MTNLSSSQEIMYLAEHRRTRRRCIPTLLRLTFETSTISSQSRYFPSISSISGSGELSPTLILRLCLLVRRIESMVRSNVCQNHRYPMTIISYLSSMASQAPIPCKCIMLRHYRAICRQVAYSASHSSLSLHRPIDIRELGSHFRPKLLKKPIIVIPSERMQPGTPRFHVARFQPSKR